MTPVIVGDRTILAPTLVKVRPGNEVAAKRGARESKADSLFIKTHAGELVGLSGRGLPLRSIRIGADAKIGTIEGKVEGVHEHLNSGREGLRKGLKVIGIPVAAISAVASFWVSVIDFNSSTLGGNYVLPQIGKDLLKIGVVGLAVAGIGVGVFALFGSKRKVDLDRLKEVGTVTTRS